jgi:hypothetical protein
MASLSYRVEMLRRCLKDVEGLLDDGPASLGLPVEVHGSATTGAFAFAVDDLVSGFGNDCLDIPGPQERSVGPLTVGLVAHHSVGAGPGPSRSGAGR